MRSAKTTIAFLILFDLVALVLTYLAGDAGSFKQAFFSLPIFIGLFAFVDTVSKRTTFQNIGFIMFVLVGLICLSTGPVHAADLTRSNAPLNEWIDTNAGNTANQLLCATIGDPGNTGLFGCKGKELPLHKILKIFNLSVLAIGAMFFSWVLVSAIMSSAAEGVFLGKRNHSQWGPLRVTMGGAALIPAFGGFNLAQLIMVWATAVGVGIAGAGASGASSVTTQLTETYSAPVGMTSGATLLKQMAEPTSCALNWNKRIDRWINDRVEDTEATSLLFGVRIREVKIEGAQHLQLYYGEQEGKGGYRTDECGTVSVKIPNPDETDDPGVRTIYQAIAGAIRTAFPILAKEAVESYIVLRKGSLDAISKQAVADRLAQAANAYDKTLLDAGTAAAAAANTTSQQQAIAKGDWIMFGFAQVSKTMRTLETTKGTSTPPKTTPPDRQAPEADKDQFDLTFADGVPSADPTNVKRGLSPAAVLESINAQLKTQVDRLGVSVAGFIRSFTSKPPLAALTDMGVKLLSWTGDMFGISLAGFLTGTLISFAFPAIGDTMGFLGNAALVIFIPLIFFGLKLAVIIPMQPIIVWTGAVLNWLVIVIEALFGAPLWALVHLDMEGDGLNMQRTGHGYIFLLNLFFRPIIMLGALIFAYSVMSAMFALVGSVFASLVTGVASATSSWWVGLLIICGLVWMLVMFAEQLVSGCLSLVFQIPDRVFAWVGGHFGSNVGADLDRSVTGNAERGFGSFSGAAKETGMLATGGLRVSRRRKDKDKDKDKDSNTAQPGGSTDPYTPAISGGGYIPHGGHSGAGNGGGMTQPPREPNSY